MEDDPTYSEEQRQMYEDIYMTVYRRLEYWKAGTAKILSQHRKDLQTQVARIKQTIEKVLDKDTSLA